MTETKDYLKKLHHITTFIFDVDGVLTDGTLQVFNSGELVRIVNIHDGMALLLAVKKGYNVAIITGGKSIEGIVKRFQGLGVTDIFTGVKNKIKIFNEYIKAKNVQPQNVLYMGDDLFDSEVMQIVGLPVCPKNAVVEIKNLSSYIAHNKGGKGCVREVVEMVLKSQNKWYIEKDFQW